MRSRPFLPQWHEMMLMEAESLMRTAPREKPPRPTHTADGFELKDGVTYLYWARMGAIAWCPWPRVYDQFGITQLYSTLEAIDKAIAEGTCPPTTSRT